MSSQNKGENDNKGHEPGWAKSLENILDDSTSKILDLQKEVFQLSEAITRHISETNARLDKLEKS